MHLTIKYSEHMNNKLKLLREKISPMSSDFESSNSAKKIKQKNTISVVHNRDGPIPFFPPDIDRIDIGS